MDRAPRRCRSIELRETARLPARAHSHDPDRVQLGGPDADLVGPAAPGRSRKGLRSPFDPPPHGADIVLAPNVDAFLRALRGMPCCAAITSQQHFEAALESRVRILFVLRADGLEIQPLVRRAHEAQKLVAVHLDLVDGIRTDRAGVSWLARAGVDALISSRGELMAAVRRERMVAIHRLLLVRTGLLDSGIAAVNRSHADIVEILPGVILPDVRALLPPLTMPLLAGGFIRTENEARAALAAGAVAVTTSTRELWDVRFA